MTKQVRSLFYTSLPIVALALSSCMPGTATATPATAITSQPTITSAMPAGPPESTATATPAMPISPTHTPQPIPSPTRAPTKTKTPRPSSTPRPTPSPTPTPFPTLEPDEMQAFIRTMLETNGGCELPCWWGITPGTTNWQDTLDFFTHNGIAIKGKQLDLTYVADLGYRKYQTNMLDVKFQQENGKVQGISVQSSPDSTPFKDDFADAWQRYALAQILSKFGVPSQVYLGLVTGAGCLGPGIIPTYDLWVVYDELGVAIRYPGTLITENQGWLVCPSFGQGQSIGIQIQAPDASTPIVPMGIEEYFYVTGTLAGLTGTSLQAFYESFRQPESQTCLKVDDSDSPYTALTLPAESNRLSPQAEDALLVEMLQTNGGCELPCWWGITPGVTNWSEVQRRFLSYGKSTVDWTTSDLGTGHGASLFGRHDPYPFDYVLKPIFYERDDRVHLIGVFGHALGGSTWRTAGWPMPQHLAQDWQRYALSQVLARFGKPSQVRLHYWAEKDEIYSLAVIYDQLGILVEYIGAEQYTFAEDGRPTTILICLTSKPITDINLWLQAPGAEPPLAEIFSRFGGGYHSMPFGEPLPSLEEATQMSLETFYETYLDPNAQLCLETTTEHGAWYP